MEARERFEDMCTSPNTLAVARLAVSTSRVPVLSWYVTPETCGTPIHKFHNGLGLPVALFRPEL